MSENVIGTGQFFTEEVREKMIKKEVRALKKITKHLDDGKKHLCGPLITSIAFSIVQMEELRLLLKRDGYYEKYQNGANQSGMKKSIASDMLISVGKNYSMFLQRFKDFLPVGNIVTDKLADWDKKH